MNRVEWSVGPMELGIVIGLVLGLMIRIRRVKMLALLEEGPVLSLSFEMGSVTEGRRVP